MVAKISRAMKNTCVVLRIASVINTYIYILSVEISDIKTGFLNRIAERRDAVVNRRQKAKAVSSERAKKLQDSFTWQQFCNDADEV